MDDVKLEQALAGLQERLRAAAPARPTRSADCLPFSRARLLVLDPARRTPQEEAHLATCRRCRTLLAGFEHDLPHLPVWTLIRSRIGGLSAPERRMLEYHLENGGCRVCRRRLERLAELSPAVLALPVPTTPVFANSVQAAVPGPEVLASAASDGLEAELVQFRGELNLELRTRQAALNGTLAAYSFQTAEGEGLLEGYVVLGPDVEGWYAAEVRIDESRYRERVGTRLGQLWIGLVEPELLTEEEWARLEACVPGPEAEPHLRALWLDWCARALLTDRGLPARGRTILQALAERLQ